MRLWLNNKGDEKQMGVARETSVIIVTHNHARYIEKCLGTVIENNPLEIIIVDNDSSDGTPQLVKENFSTLEIIDLEEYLGSDKREDPSIHRSEFSSRNMQRGSEFCENPIEDFTSSQNERKPRIKLILSPNNRGYGAGNNLGVRYAEGKYIVVLNPDTVVEKNWLEELVKPLETSEKTITTPKILLYDGSAINTCGNINHFTGLTFTRGLNEDPGKYDVPEEVSGFSGCCFAMRKDHFEELGGFDENFFVYNEDSDLSWRAHLRGFKILYVPTSIVKHAYQLNVSPEKLYHLERNRYLILRKYLSRKDLFILLPSMVMAEVLTWGYALRKGSGWAKWKLLAVMDGLRIVVKKEEGDGNRLFQRLSKTIPVEHLAHNGIERMVNMFANSVFKWNVGVTM
ncbi:MAG: glycosyltransferase family 2 protein [Methanomassiliicoccales archaeon]|jgi:GT2 family glycosyltransferase|nr:glycosyltransferase family 2 protein [Methanomassiliicoccales archaeon]